MQCMKCGREIEAGAVFCGECLAEMEKYPVRPGTVVQLPHRPVQPAVKKQPQRRKPSIPLEDQVKMLRRWARMLACALVLCLVALIGMGYLTVKQYLDNNTKLLPGQNYSSASSTTSPSETE